jgi:predicted dehydrogenase
VTRDSRDTSTVGRRLRGGIVGGGRGAFIGAIHRIAAELDGQALIVAGAMSSDPLTAELSARDWFLDRSYGSYQQMALAEASRPDGIDFVIIATPNHLHAPVATAFIEAGIHVICDKPLALSLAEGEGLASLVNSSRLVFALTHTYTGYPMVREARDRVARGEVGGIRKVLVEYQQDWLMMPLENSGNKQAEWRTDPARAGIGGSLGDIGTHAANLLEFVSGLQIDSLCADLSTWVAGRRLDDDANVLLRLSNGAKGVLVCSQIACGEANNLNLRIYGTEGGLEWHQEEPNTLLFKPAGAATKILRTGGGYLSDASRSVTRTPSGHPEGYLEAFATLYRSFMADIRRSAAGESLVRDYPTIADGVRGLRFIEKAVASSSLGTKWMAMRDGGDSICDRESR